MTLHALSKSHGRLQPCYYPPQDGAGAWCHTHCSDHQNLDGRGFFAGRCREAHCIHDPANEESPLYGRRCTNCDHHLSAMDAGYYPETDDAICWGCMTEDGEWAPILRRERPPDDQ